MNFCRWDTVAQKAMDREAGSRKGKENKKVFGRRSFSGDEREEGVGQRPSDWENCKGVGLHRREGGRGNSNHEWSGNKTHSKNANKRTIPNKKAGEGKYRLQNTQEFF